MKKLKKIFDLLAPNEQKRVYHLFFLILVMASFDALGVASILPFIAVLANPQLIETNEILNYLYQASHILGVSNTTQFLFFFGILVFLLFITTLTIRALTIYAQIRFSLMREYSIGKRLIEGYLHQPYSWFLNRHSADLGKSILSEVKEVVENAIVPILNVIVYGTLTMALLVLLFVINTKLAVSVGLFLALSYGIIFYFMRKFLSQIGSRRLKANKDRFISTSEAFASIKEVKFGGLEEIYIDRFSKPAQIYAKNQSLAEVIARLPRYFIEAIAFGGIIILVLSLMYRGNEFSNIIPIISLYVFAGYRLIPSLQQIYNAITRLRFSGAALDSLHKDLTNLKFSKRIANTYLAMPLTKSIKLNNVNFNYPNSKHNALKNINLSIPAFSKVGIAGTTGSGKTTIVDLILGLLDPDKEGTLMVDENIITENNKRSWQKNIGYVPQQIYLSEGSIAANIALGVDQINIDCHAVEQAAKIANLHEFVTTQLPKQYNTNIGEKGVRISGGQKQRVGIARALYHKPQVLILDEATSALDNYTEQSIMNDLYNIGNKITIILIAHRLDTLKKCDIIFLLEQGQLKFQGSYDLFRSSYK